MRDPRYPTRRDEETDLMDGESLRDYRARHDQEHERRISEARRFWTRREREDDFTPLCAAPGCSNFDTGSGYCARHTEEAA